MLIGYALPLFLFSYIICLMPFSSAVFVRDVTSKKGQNNVYCRFYANTYCGYNNIHYLHENRLTFERLTLSDEMGAVPGRLRSTFNTLAPHRSLAKVKVNSSPASGRLRTAMVPRWKWTALRTMESPSPVPPISAPSRVRPSCAR